MISVILPEYERRYLPWQLFQLSPIKLLPLENRESDVLCVTLTLLLTETVWDGVQIHFLMIYFNSQAACQGITLLVKQLALQRRAWSCRCAKNDRIWGQKMVWMNDIIGGTNMTCMVEHVDEAISRKLIKYQPIQLQISVSWNMIVHQWYWYLSVLGMFTSWMIGRSTKRRAGLFFVQL